MRSSSSNPRVPVLTTIALVGLGSAVFMIVGFQVLLIGLLADVISANRKLLEASSVRLRTIEDQLRRLEAATDVRKTDLAPPRKSRAEDDPV